MTLELDWQERGGPPPKRGRRSGFGSRLIGMVIEHQPGGQLHRAFEPEGLDARLILPLTHERWPQPVTSPMPDDGTARLDGRPSE